MRAESSAVVKVTCDIITGISFTELLHIVELSISAGGSGVCIGRQVFGSNDPESCVKALRAVVHENSTSVEASKLL